MKSKGLFSLIVWGGVLVTLVILLVVVPGIVKAQKLHAGVSADFQNSTSSQVTLSYQSRLTDKDQPANGLYDFEFELYDQPAGGNQLGQTQTTGQVEVNDGQVTVSLNFEEVPVARTTYLEVSVRPGGSSEPFTTLSPRQLLAPALQDEDIGASAISGELWKLGFISEDSAAYSSIIGRVTSATAAFRSDRGTDLYYIFPAPASQKTVQAANLYVLSRNGSYSSGNAILSLEILDYSGTLQHTVSTNSIDLETTPADTWTSVSLSGTADDLIIASGEFLAFRVNFSNGATNDLDARVIFEVEVR